MQTTVELYSNANSISCILFTFLAIFYQREHFTCKIKLRSRSDCMRFMIATHTPKLLNELVLHTYLLHAVFKKFLLFRLFRLKQFVNDDFGECMRFILHNALHSRFPSNAFNVQETKFLCHI